MRHYGYGYRDQSARKALGRLALLLLLLALFVAAAFGIQRMQGLLQELAVARVSNSVSRIVSEAVGDAIADGSFQYDRMIAFETDKEGRITAVKSNMTEFNRLQTVVLDEVLARISEVSTRELGIPIGSLTGSALLSGRGPRITVRMQSVGSSTAKLRNEFTSSGINQSRHQIVMDVDVRISVLLPGCVTSVPVSQSFSVAETVLVGAVPENYTYFSTHAEGDSADKVEEYIMNNG